MRPRLHGSGQIFARTKTCTVLRYNYTRDGTGRIFERPIVQVWDLPFSGSRLKMLLYRLITIAREILGNSRWPIPINYFVMLRDTLSVKRHFVVFYPEIKSPSLTVIVTIPESFLSME